MNGRSIGKIINLLAEHLNDMTKQENRQIEESSDIDEFVVTISKSYLIVYGIGSLLFGLATLFGVLSSIFQTNKNLYLNNSLIILFLATLAFIYGFIYCYNWRLEIDSEIRLIRVFKEDLVFSFADIYSVESNSEKSTLVLCNDFTFKIDKNCICYNLFLERLSSEEISIYREGLINDENDEDDEYAGYVVSSSKETMAMPIIGAIILGIVIIIKSVTLKSFSFSDILAILVVMVFEFIFIYGIIYCSKFKLEVYDYEIILRRAFKDDKSFSFEDIYSVTQEKNSTNVYLNDGDKFNIIFGSINTDLFLETLSENGINVKRLIL